MKYYQCNTSNCIYYHWLVRYVDYKDIPLNPACNDCGKEYEHEIEKET